jgi:hypothetical protein
MKYGVNAALTKLTLTVSNRADSSRSKLERWRYENDANGHNRTFGLSEGVLFDVQGEALMMLVSRKTP